MVKNLAPNILFIPLLNLKKKNKNHVINWLTVYAVCVNVCEHMFERGGKYL